VGKRSKKKREGGKHQKPEAKVKAGQGGREGGRDVVGFWGEEDSAKRAPSHSLSVSFQNRVLDYCPPFPPYHSDLTFLHTTELVVSTLERLDVY
jgi:hypothetical protein